MLSVLHFTQVGRSGKRHWLTKGGSVWLAGVQLITLEQHSGDSR